MADVAKPLTEAARGLVVAEAAHFEDFAPPAAFFATRDSAELPSSIPWGQRAATLRERASFAPVTGKDLGYTGDKGLGLGT